MTVGFLDGRKKERNGREKISRSKSRNNFFLRGVIANGTDRLKIVEKCVPLDDVLKHVETSPKEDVKTAALALLNAFFIKSNKLPVIKGLSLSCMSILSCILPRRNSLDSINFFVTAAESGRWLCDRPDHIPVCLSVCLSGRPSMNGGIGNSKINISLIYCLSSLLWIARILNFLFFSFFFLLRRYCCLIVLHGTLAPTWLLNLDSIYCTY